MDVFVVPKEHWVCALNRCGTPRSGKYFGPTGREILVPWMFSQSCNMVQGCEWCKLFEGAQVKAPLQSI